MDKDPVLYIHQPKFHKPVPQMQESFRWKQEKLNPDPTDKKKKERRRIQPIDEWDSNELTEKNELESEEVLKNETTPLMKGMKPLKPFKFMTINEKLHYLNRHPLKSAAMCCEFISGNSRVKGKLIKLNDQSIHVVALSGDEVEITLKDLSDISIIAFI
jgi:hypothetical protein